jgi:hypothetical protein
MTKTQANPDKTNKAKSVDAESHDATRRAVKARQRNAHPPRNPDARAARKVRADATKKALESKLGKHPHILGAANFALDKFANVKLPAGRPASNALGIAIAEMKKTYATQLTSSQLLWAKGAVIAELSAH